MVEVLGLQLDRAHSTCFLNGKVARSLIGLNRETAARNLIARSSPLLEVLHGLALRMGLGHGDKSLEVIWGVCWHVLGKLLH